jgi:hypothetical protein
MTEFIIVGQGLAANVLAHLFHKEKISFKIIGLPNLSNCSAVAAGIWNPIVFKRFTKSWLAHETIPFLNKFYTQCENTLGVKFVTQRNLFKPFVEEQEKKLWLKKSKDELEQFLDDTIYQPSHLNLKNCVVLNAYGLVKQAGNIDLSEFLNASAEFFKLQIISEEFDYDKLKIEEDKIIYKNLVSKKIIFCEGYLVKNNPYFNWIPLKPVKGEVFTITTPDLNLTNSVFNKNGFIMDLGNQCYKVGATYQWSNLNETPSPEGKIELEEKLKQLISCNYSITKHEAGIRPSSIDRRPIIGSHPNFKNMFVFNGLGTKGVMLAPYFANNFVNFYQKKQKLNTEVDIQRFYHLFNHAN